MMRGKTLLVCLSLAVAQVGLAVPVPGDMAKLAVDTWLERRAQLSARMGARAASVWSCQTNGASFHVVKVEGGGFVVTSADTETEPIIAFSESPDLVVSEKNPLWALLTRDLASRPKTALKAAGQSGRKAVALSTAAAKWNRLTAGAATSTNGLLRALQATAGLETVSDLRVAPLLQTLWNQEQDSLYSNQGSPCYNYYTPNNYPCGCVATAGAQIMRYHCHPTGSVTPVTRTCEVETGQNWIDEYSYSPVYTEYSYTMQGGTYDWANMPLVPAEGTTLDQRQAIGKLTSDIGIACYMKYGEGGSGTGGYLLAPAFTNVFGYANALPVQYSGNCAAAVWQAALLPNFDAKLPVEVSLNGWQGGHAVVADGYGYSLSTLYVHFNMGWAGAGNAWYAPPEVEDFSVVDGFVCNVYPTGAAGGVICSGRVLSSEGKPVSGATVSAAGSVGARTSCQTDANGIYALILSAGSHTLTAAKGMATANKSVTLTANVGVRLGEGDSGYYITPSPQVNNKFGQDFSLEVESPTPITYTVRFHDGYGSGTSDQTMTYGVNTTLRTSVFARSGYTFKGWATSSGGSVIYTEGATVSNLASTQGAVVHLYAVWQLSVTVTLAEALDCTNLTFTTGGDAPWLVDAGSEFVGNTAGRSGAIGANQTSWVETVVTGTGQFYFRCRASSESVDYDYLELTVDGTLVKRFGGTMEDWSRHAYLYVVDGSPHVFRWTYRKDGSVDGGQDCAWLDNVRWTPAPSCTVTFDANGGVCGLVSHTVLAGWKLGELPVPTRAGYEFYGWFDQAVGGMQYSSGNVIESSLTLYAHWGGGSGGNDPGGDDDPEEDDGYGLPPAKGATYNGCLLDDNEVLAGTFSLVVKAPKKGSTVGEGAMTVVDAMTGKKVKYVGGVDFARGVGAANAKGQNDFAGLRVGAEEIYGDFKSWIVIGGIDAAKAKNAALLNAMNGLNKRTFGLALFEQDARFTTLTVAVSSKGKCKVAGSLPDGSKLSASAQMFVCDGMGCVPVVYAKKGVSVCCLLWIDLALQRLEGVTGYPATWGCEYGSADQLRSGDYEVWMDKALVGDCVPDYIAETPFEIQTTFDGKKFDAGKAAKVSYKQDELSFAGDNISGLTLTCMKGVLKGSLTVYSIANGKLVKTKFTIAGVVIGEETVLGMVTNKKAGYFPVWITRK